MGKGGPGGGAGGGRGAGLGAALRFLPFAARLGYIPEPGQEAALRVAFQGEEPGDVGPAAVRIYGYERGTPPRARDVAELVWGARGGKTFWGALRMLHLACTVRLDRLAPGEHGYVFLVAPKLDLAGQALNYIKGAISRDKVLSEMADPQAERIVLHRKGGRGVTIQPVAASRGGAGQRGRSLLGALLDETAFFRDETTGAVNDAAIFRALAPRVIEGGQLVIQSTPWARTGLLYDLWAENYGRPMGALVSHAPTAILRSDEKILAYVAREYARDPENARIEFGAEFGAASATTWLDPEALEAAVGPAGAIAPGDAVGAGGDLGFARNSSALVVARQGPDGLIDLPLVEERRPAPGVPLRPSEVCGEFAGLLRGAGARSLVADRHYQETIREALSGVGLLLEEPPAPDEAWALVREMLRSGRLRLPQHPLLMAQLKAVRGKLGSGGTVRIELASTPDGRHGDLAAAAALAIWAVVRRPHRIPVAVAAEDRERAERLARWREGRQREREQKEAGAWYES